MNLSSTTLARLTLILIGTSIICNALQNPEYISFANLSFLCQIRHNKVRNNLLEITQSSSSAPGKLPQRLF